MTLGKKKKKIQLSNFLCLVKYGAPGLSFPVYRCLQWMKERKNCPYRYLIKTLDRICLFWPFLLKVVVTSSLFTNWHAYTQWIVGPLGKIKPLSLQYFSPAASFIDSSLHLCPWPFTQFNCSAVWESSTRSPSWVMSQESLWCVIYFMLWETRTAV